MIWHNDRMQGEEFSKREAIAMDNDDLELKCWCYLDTQSEQVHLSKAWATFSMLKHWGWCEWR
jgi:hypothetical protein